jgi:hypothetical protein
VKLNTDRENTLTGDAPLAEHIVSILAGAYICWGGLCGTLAGGHHLIGSIKRYAIDTTWVNAVNMCKTQDVLIPNVAAMEEQVSRGLFTVSSLFVGSGGLLLQGCV